MKTFDIAPMVTVRWSLGLCLVLFAVAIWTPSPAAQSSQGVPTRIDDLEARVAALEAVPGGQRFIKGVGDRVAVFFWENGINPNTQMPEPQPSIPLAPISEEKTFEFETGRAVVSGGTIRSVLQIDLYLRQRYFYRNAGQNRFHVHTNPFIEIESPAFVDVTDQAGQPLNGILKFAVLGNGLHLAAAKTLVSGEQGDDSRGNFGRVVLTKASLDRFRAGTGASFFANDFTVRVSIENTVRGISHFVAGTSSQIYGQ
jgi:hypothetical protein